MNALDADEDRNHCIETPTRQATTSQRKVYNRTIPGALTGRGRDEGLKAWLSFPLTRWPGRSMCSFAKETLGSLSDAQLLERFVASGAAAGAAFDVLMARHGPMVLGVCRRILRDGHAADDAFQATFLVLVRRAGLSGGASRWGHGCTASHGAWPCGRGRPPRCARNGKPARRSTAATAVTEPGDDDLGPALHAEIDRLPEKYRAPIVLCYLQGRTIDEASRQLGWPVGTVGGRLARARDRLRDRLVRQGLVAPTVLIAALAPNPLRWRPCRGRWPFHVRRRASTRGRTAGDRRGLRHRGKPFGGDRANHGMDQVHDRCRDLWAARGPGDRGCRHEPDGRCPR